MSVVDYGGELIVMWFVGVCCLCVVVTLTCCPFLYFIIGCILYAVDYWLSFVRCLLAANCCMLFVVSCVFVVACCLICVV